MTGYFDIKLTRFWLGVFVDPLREQLRVLSKKYSLEIIGLLYESPNYVSNISSLLGLPYATTQQRVNELVRANILESYNSLEKLSRRPVRMVRLKNFRLELSPRIISQIVKS